jgi:hypothetical protein
MARLKTARTIKWAGVEFQRDLLRPQKLVKLGAILLETSTSSSGIVVIGREPVPTSRPQEFENVGDITMNLAAHWVDHMMKDILESGLDNIFETLSRRWKGNLYIVEPKSIRTSDVQGSLEVISKRFYEKFVGEPFDSKPARPKRLRKPGVHAPSSAFGPPWKFEEVKRHALGEAVCA